MTHALITKIDASIILDCFLLHFPLTTALVLSSSLLCFFARNKKNLEGCNIVHTKIDATILLIKKK